LIELGSIFEPEMGVDREYRHLGLIGARRGKRAESELYDRLKGAIETWAWRRFARPTTFSRAAAAADRPWEHPYRTAAVFIDKTPVGRVSVVDLSLRRAMDEHLSAWSIAWAELRLDGLETSGRPVEPLGTIPNHPLVEMDFSILVPATEAYTDVVSKMTRFDHPLLKQMRYVASYEGEAIDTDRRSLTFRIVIGDDARTLTETDSNAFRIEFESYLQRHGYDIRA